MQTMRTMEEVERIVLTAWRTAELDLQTELSGELRNTQGIRERYFLARLKRGEEGGREVGVSVRELWEWLFQAPPPYSCLAFLHREDQIRDDSSRTDHVEDDDAGNVGESRDGDEVEEDCVRKTDEEKMAIFRTIARRIAYKEHSDEAGLIPAKCDVELMLRRINLARQKGFDVIAAMISIALKFRLLVHDQMVEAFIETFRSNDSDLVLKFLSLFALPMSNLRAQSAIQHLAAHHPDERVRLASVQTLTRWADLGNHGDTESFQQAISDVCKEEPSASVREAVFRPRFRSLPPEVVMKLSVLGIQDKHVGVATAASSLLQHVLMNHYDEKLVKPALPLLATVLTQNLMRGEEAKSLLSQAVEVVIGNMPTYEKALASLPQELQNLIAKERKMRSGGSSRQEERSDEYDGRKKRTSVTLREATRRCIAALCRSQEWCAEMLSVATTRQDQEVTWQVRESAVTLLDIVAQYGPSEAVDGVWSHLSFIYACLADPVMEVQKKISSMLAYLVVKQYHKGQKERPTRVIEALMDRLNSEIARRSILEALNTIISLEVIPDAHLGLRIIDQCFTLCMSLPRDDEALPEVLKLIGLLCGHVNDSVFVASAREYVMSIVERFLTTSAPDHAYLALADLINHAVELGSEDDQDAAAYVERLCKVIKREIAWLCSFLADTADPQPNRVRAFDSLGAFLNAISLMLEQEDDVLKWIPVHEWLPAMSILKKEDTTDRALNEGLIVLGEMSFFAPEALMAAPDEHKHVLFDFILHSLRRQPYSSERMLNALRTMGTLALYTPSLVDPQWVATCTELIAPHFQRLVELDRGNSVQSVLQLGRYFTTAVHSDLAGQAIDTYVEGWIFESEREKADEVIGWANLIQHVVKLFLDQGGRAADIPLMPELVVTTFRLVFMMIGSEPRFAVNHPMDSGGMHLDEDIHMRATKEAVMAMMQEVCGTTSLDCLTSLYGHLLQNTYNDSQVGDLLAAMRHLMPSSPSPSQGTAASGTKEE